MDLRLLSYKGLPKDCLLSIRVGSCRQQAPVNSQRPYKFPALAAKEQMKVDVYVPIGHTRLLLGPGDSRFSVPLMSAAGAAAYGSDGDSLIHGKSGDASGMSLEFEVSGNSDVSAAQDCSSATATEGGAAEEEHSNGVSVSERVSQWSRPSSANSTASFSASFQKSARHRAVLADAQPYFEQHGVMSMMQALLQAVIKEKPADPSQYMIQVLQNSCQAAAGRGGSLHTTSQSQPKRLNRPHSAGCLRTRVSEGALPQFARPQSATKIVKFSAPTIEEYTATNCSDGSLAERGSSRSRRAFPSQHRGARLFAAEVAPVASGTGLPKEDPTSFAPAPAPAVSTVPTPAIPVMVVSYDAAQAPDSADVAHLGAASVQQAKEQLALDESSPAPEEQLAMSVDDSHKDKDDTAHLARVKIKVRRGPQPSQATPQSPQVPSAESPKGVPQSCHSGAADREAAALDDAAPAVLQDKVPEDPGRAREALGPACTDGLLPQHAV
jgi:hypothetical protein